MIHFLKEHGKTAHLQEMHNMLYRCKFPEIPLSIGVTSGGMVENFPFYQKKTSKICMLIPEFHSRSFTSSLVNVLVFLFAM